MPHGKNLLFVVGALAAGYYLGKQAQANASTGLFGLGFLGL
jgi:hypothetical protein